VLTTYNNSMVYSLTKQVKQGGVQMNLSWKILNNPITDSKNKHTYTKLKEKKELMNESST